MCGIIGYVGNKHKVSDVLVKGLKSLEYRGYDSSGVAIWKDSEFFLTKTVGKIVNLENKLNSSDVLDGNIGIAHTRWATHGKPSDINSHPHRVGNVTIVHNGIIENYLEIKNELIEKGITFKSETDTEVGAALLSYLYNNGNDCLTTIKLFMDKVIGSYALGIVFDDCSDILYAVKKDSPLIVGYGCDENFIASDVPAIIDYTKEYSLLKEKHIAVIMDNNITFYNESLKKVKLEVLTAGFNQEEIKKDGYDHFMLKEIMEQDKMVKNLLSIYLNNGKIKIPDLSKYDSIHIVACGSALYAGMIGSSLIEKYGDIPVTVEVASEYRYKKNFYTDNTLVIVVSQSGETADTIASLRKVKELGIDTLAIVNIQGSTIAREADMVLYIYAGIEIAVATTKAYLLQVVVFTLIALSMSKDKNFFMDAYKTIDHKIRNILDKRESYFELANYLYQKNDVFFLGRGIDYAMTLEGSLKLKEISYIHSEAYQSGELKHGTISLIEEGTPVIAIMTDSDLVEKQISNIKEVKARGAFVILITTEELDSEFDCCDKKIVIENSNDLLNSVLVVPVLQLISYQTAKNKGCDIDQPKNLAKSVTVE